ncbi:hypothetical protein CL654_03170 [bacterium]|nr:hypothetical protein [bacterium]|tara:strand:+ start:22054 stop:23103 length:1050 start_codon:yes stop_codon:yes gene_type:complete
MEGRNINVTITLETVAKTVFFLILLWILYQLIDLLLVVLTAVVLASAIEPAARWFARYKVPRVVGVLIMYVLVFGIFIGTFYFFIPPLIDDLQGITKQLPQYLDSPTISNTPFGDQLPGTLTIRETLDGLSRTVSDLQSNFLQILSVVFGGVLSFVLIIVISFYLAVQEDGIKNFLSIITPVKHEKYVIGLWQRAQTKIGLWMRGQLLLALIIGVLVYLGLSIFQVKYALLLALIAAMFELIPIFGPILAGIPAVGIAFTDGGASSALLVIALYVIIQQFENQLIYPLVVKQVVGVPSIIAIIALIAGAELAGLLGIILSIPIAAILMELFNDLDKEKHHLREENHAAA